MDFEYTICNNIVKIKYFYEYSTTNESPESVSGCHLSFLVGVLWRSRKVSCFTTEF